MSITSTPTATFHMTVSDAYDGAIRILTDAQRFGLDLISLDLHPAQFGQGAGDCGADMKVVLSFSWRLDRELLTRRFIRHATVLHVRAGETEHQDRDHARGEAIAVVGA
jgi:hypothetical protein